MMLPANDRDIVEIVRLVRVADIVERIRQMNGTITFTPHEEGKRSAGVTISLGRINVWHTGGLEVAFPFALAAIARDAAEARDALARDLEAKP